MSDTAVTPMRELDYGRAFRLIRAAFDLRQEPLAEAMGTTPHSLSAIERGSREPGLQMLRRLSHSTGFSLAGIMVLAGDPGLLDDDHLCAAILRLLIEPQAIEKEGV